MVKIEDINIKEKYGKDIEDKLKAILVTAQLLDYEIRIKDYLATYCIIEIVGNRIAHSIVPYETDYMFEVILDTTGDHVWHTANTKEETQEVLDILINIL